MTSGPSASTRDDLVGRVLGGRYRLVALLGGGASAAVFAAEDLVLRRPVAVKVLHPALAADQAFLRRFRTEAQVVAALRHPNVLVVHDWGNDGTPYLVTELLEGGSVKDLVDRGFRATPSQALGLGLQACRGLDHAHRRGLVHRDIKPANLLFGGEARLRVADFGLARAIAEAAATEPLGIVLGTARYASPEQAQGRSLDGRSDVYSLALVLIEVVTGDVPFAADTSAATLLARLDHPLEVPDAVGPLAEALAAAGRTERDERVDAAGFARLLKSAAAQLDPPAPLPIAVFQAGVATGGATDGGAPTAHAGPPVPPPPDGAEGATRADAVHADAAGAAAVPTGPVADAEGLPPAPPPAPGQHAAPPSPEPSGAAATSAGPVRPPGPSEVPTVLPGRPGVVAADPSGASGDPTEAVPLTPFPVLPQPPAEAPMMAAEDPRPPRRRRIRLLLVLIVLLLVAALAAGAAIVQPWRSTVDVPVIVGLSRDEAAARLRAADLTLREGGRARSESADVGVVLASTPARQRTGRAVTVTLSDGPEPRVLPVVDARLAEQVETELRGQGLNVVVTPVDSEAVPAGTALGIDPPAGSRVPRGASVTLSVSAGPPARPVPDVAGKSLSQAEAAFRSAGLAITRVDAFSDRVAAGAVVSTNPSAGTSVRPGQVVAVTVSKGPDVVPVPDLTGLGPVEAKQRLNGLGLQVGATFGPPDGRVFSSQPAAATKVKRGSSVAIYTR